MQVYIMHDTIITMFLQSPFCKIVIFDDSISQIYNKHNAELQRTGPTPKDKGPFSIKNT